MNFIIVSFNCINGFNFRFYRILLQNVKNGLISKDNFLTNNTTDVLRMTLKSTINLSEYSLNKHGFTYVITNKIIKTHSK